ncbi:LysR substrate-binding domain-containing protein [Azospirillum griseum]|uniref:LysR family transcriptional regulator n=1 Tax=Azospirillum griseum TaxID=2496639 RepID=A0A431VG88_9PROT|nr:LysR substrate-binding domain-containing protein [Azospirillum griseum]RTR19497.1 LysR family transcriptional regulator [Azospirillum griseum]
MDRFDSMRVFTRVAEAGSFAAAAKPLTLSPTMIANHIRALEEDLGVRLLNRTTRRQSLTEAGTAYLAHCHSVLAQMAEMRADLLAQRAEPRGRLRVSAPVSFGVERLIPALADYLAACPAVDLALDVNDRAVDLVDEGYEAVIRIGPLTDSRLIARPLTPYRMVVAASPAYLARMGHPTAPEELAHHTCLAFRYAAKSKWRFTGEDGTVQIAVQPRLEVNSGPGLRAAALAGIGVVMQPEALLANDLAAGRLVALFPDHALPSRPMTLLHQKDRRMSAKLRSFIDFVTARFPP